MIRLRRYASIAAIGLSAVSLGGYLWFSLETYGLGLPLDDAWIHQTYARNLAERGEWAFLPGEPSAGSTAPLWAALLAFARVAGLGPVAATFVFGVTALALTGLICDRWLRARLPDLRISPLWVPVLVGLEWHLVWAGLSGMETLALALLTAAVLFAAEARGFPPLAVGILIGLGVWLRPDALLLALPAGVLIAVDRQHSPVERARRMVQAVLGLSLLLLPYLAFNRSLSGEWWPSTYFAKQAEYASLRAEPLWRRFFLQLRAPLAGAGIVLAPGVVVGAAYAMRERRLERLVPLLWVGCFLGAYALRLPVVYQHGRYAMPVIPVLIVLGAEGMARWCRPGAAELGRRLASRLWLASLGMVTLVFWFIGGRAYGRDVAIIETEMVRVAHWVRENTPPDALVAAHDIGALGYYGERRLIDLAGLVSPEVIPILRDEAALAAHLQERQAGYLATFPEWYPVLTRGLTPIFSTGGAFSPAAGGENMAIYLWGRASFAPQDMAVLYSGQSRHGRDDHGDHRRHYRR
ncbi:MAG TPA: hypothetical protein VJJ46_13300 [Anaerolineales bacterium]|nr:hypothetical protein [Anaerolineales bacterium]